jgi:hypothetical protein
VNAAPPLPPKLAALGPIMQIAYVPTDFDAAIDYWTQVLGVGPFFLWEHVAVDHLQYRGARSTPDFSVALSYWGDLQIELIRQDNDARSIYRDWNSNALHHVQIVAPDYDKAVTAVRDGDGRQGPAGKPRVPVRLLRPRTVRSGRLHRVCAAPGRRQRAGREDGEDAERRSDVGRDGRRAGAVLDAARQKVSFGMTNPRPGQRTRRKR